MNKDTVLSILHEVKHPETSNDIVTMGMVENLVVTDDKIQFTLVFARSRDPLSASIKKACEQIITSALPQYKNKITVFIKEAEAKKVAPKIAPVEGKSGVMAKHVIAVSSAKGGVGKSTVTANLASALHNKGYKVGILDADIYGPSQHIMFGVEDYKPTGEKIEGRDVIYPAEAGGIKIMSIGFFIDPNDALVWRGPMATSALKQMIHQTVWGELDYLLIDLPPGTGDIHLSIISEIKVTGAIIVSTPQKIALADVVRGISMFRGEHVNIPVLGIVENMAWFTPAELPDNKYYIFGKGGARELSEKFAIPLLAEIPLIQSIRESADNGTPVVNINSNVSNFYTTLADNIITKQ